MMRLEYVSNRGDTVDLLQYATRIYQGSFHAYEWDYDSAELPLGINVYGYTRSETTYEITVAVRGTDAEKRAALNNMTSIFERDVINNTRGKLWWDNSYIECNIIASQTAPSETFYGAEKTLTVLCPYPFWIVPQDFSFAISSESAQLGFLDYPYDYKYDYTPKEGGREDIYINHYGDSNFTMHIFGSVVDPSVVIGGHTYTVYDTVLDGEYITIDSRDKTVIKHNNNGEIINLFDSRNKAQSVFQRIPSGNVTVSWSGSFAFSLTVYVERSEPLWTT